MRHRRKTPRFASPRTREEIDALLAQRSPALWSQRWARVLVRRRERGRLRLILNSAITCAVLRLRENRGPRRFALACAYARVNGYKRPMTDAEHDDLRARLRERRREPP